jgi:hypothetical protein
MSQASTLQRIFERLNQIEDYLCPVEFFLSYKVCREVPDFDQPEGQQFTKVETVRVKVPRCLVDYLSLLLELTSRSEVDCGKRIAQESVIISGFTEDLLSSDGLVSEFIVGENFPTSSSSPTPTP